MRLFAVAIWVVVLFVLTCTSSLNQLLEHQNISFHVTMNPKFNELWFVSDARVTDSHWLFIKLGHFTGFAVLQLLLYQWIEKVKKSCYIAILMALLSEIVQLYFMRDGRAVDVLIDCLGILLAAGICSISAHLRDVSKGAQLQEIPLSRTKRE